MTELATYTVDRLWEDEEFVLSRRVSNDKQVSLLVSMPASAQPTVETLTPLGHAYVLRDKFDSTWAARPVALERPDGRSALLIEDPGGEVLARMIWEALGSDAVPARRDQDNSPFGVNVPMEVKRDRV